MLFIDRLNQSKLMPQVVALLIILVQLFLTSQAVCPTSIGYTPNYKYSYTGKYRVDINQYNQTSTDFSSSPISLKITYPLPLMRQSIHGAVIISDFAAIKIKERISAVLKIKSLQQADMTVQLYTHNLTNIKKISIAYFIIRADLIPDFNFMIVTFSQSYPEIGKQISHNSSYSVTVPLSSDFNVSNQTVIGFLSGVHASPLDQNSSISLSFLDALINSSHITVRISSMEEASTVVYQISYTFFLYNQQGINALPTKYFEFNSTTQNKEQRKSVDISYEIASMNTFIGLSSFTLSNADIFSFQIQISSSAMAIRNQGLKNAVFSFLFFSSYYCSYKTSYLFPYANMCFETCPNGLQPNDTTLECIGDATLSTQNFACQDESSSQSTGVIIGIAGGSATLVIIIGILCYKYNGKNNVSQPHQQPKKQQLDNNPVEKNEDIHEKSLSQKIIQQHKLEQEIEKIESDLNLNDIISEHKDTESHNPESTHATSNRLSTAKIIKKQSLQISQQENLESADQIKKKGSQFQQFSYQKQANMQLQKTNSLHLPERISQEQQIQIQIKEIRPWPLPKISQVKPQGSQNVSGISFNQETHQSDFDRNLEERIDPDHQIKQLSQIRSQQQRPQ